MESIAIAGERLVQIVIKVGYYVTLIAGTGFSIQHLTKRDFKGAISTVLGYGGAFAAVCAFRWLLDLVKATFG